MSLSEQEIQAVAAQLACPKGEMGIAVGNKMLHSNIGMIRATAAALSLVEGDALLEIGHGNGGHIAQLFADVPHLAYVGLELSELMHAEAAKANADMVASGQAEFVVADAAHMPFAEPRFTKAMTVNTLYFWKDPVAILNEVYRVLKPGGQFGIGFAERRFMEHLPFTKYGFTLYDTPTLTKLVASTPFQILGFRPHTEQVETQTGVLTEREFTVAVLGK